MKKSFRYLMSIVFYGCFCFFLLIFHGIQWVCFYGLGYKAHKHSIELSQKGMDVEARPTTKITTSLSGSFSLTENDYHVLVYYRILGEQYDALIGVGKTNSFELVN